MKDIVDLNNLINEYSDMIYHIALRYLGSKEDAEDIVQEVFMRYIKQIKRGKYFDDEEHEKCWLIRVTMNLCCNEINSAKRRTTLPFKESLYCEINVSSDNILYNCLNNLNSKYKEIFILHYIEDMKVSEISKVLRISEANVKTRLKRAREQIRKFIKRGEKSIEKI